MSKVEFKGTLWKSIEKALSFYCDRNTPKWLKSKRALRKEIKRRFIVAMKEEIQKQFEEDERLILYGDPTGIKPVGIINAFKEGKNEQ